MDRSVGDASFIGMQQLKGVSLHKSHQIKLKTSTEVRECASAILHNGFIVQKSNECCYNRPLCKDSFGLKSPLAIYTVLVVHTYPKEPIKSKGKPYFYLLEYAYISTLIKRSFK